MVHLRRPHIAHVLIACACSGTDPSVGGSTIEGVHALESLPCNGMCPQENTAGAALARGHVWLTRDYWYCSNNNGNCGANTTLHVGLGEAAFGADGGLSVIEQTPDSQGASVSSGVGVAPDESVAYFAYTNDAKGLVMIQGFAGGTDAGVGQVAQQGYITGVVADGRSAVVGVASKNGNMGGAPSEQVDQGGGGFGSGGPGNNAGGTISRVNLDDGGVVTQTASFDITVTHHLMVASGGSIYGIGGGSVWVAPVDLSAAPTPVGTIPPAQTGNACQPPNNCVSAGVGLDVANGIVAWSVLQGVATCNNGPCTFTSPTCSVWKNGAPQSTRIYQGTTACLGLAIDATYAYFALVEPQLDTSCNGCNSYDIFTTGIARIALNGADTQQPTVLKIDSQRLYGPRRFFVDDTYVYGIDPAYVLRIPKSAFGP